MTLRLCKIALVASVSFFLFLVVLNNAFFDYRSNYEFVHHVLAMDSVFSGDAQIWRAFRDPTPEDNSFWIYHAFYWTIIAWEAAAMILCGLGAIRLWLARADAPAFNRAKSIATLGLTISLLQWFVAFISVGGEWFLMWQSKWNGQDAAFRMFACIGIILLLLVQRDED